MQINNALLFPKTEEVEQMPESNDRADCSDQSGRPECLTTSVRVQGDHAEKQDWYSAHHWDEEHGRFAERTEQGHSRVDAKQETRDDSKACHQYS
ncbi:MAG: hypothetical protein AAF802_32150 [Planctomycetota bacterium]